MDHQRNLQPRQDQLEELVKRLTKAGEALQERLQDCEDAGLQQIQEELRAVCEELLAAWTDLEAERQETPDRSLRRVSPANWLEERDQLLDELQDLAVSLEQERDILETIMANTDAQLAYLDPDFNFLRVNDAYAQGSGYRRRDLIGRNHFELFPHAENQAIFERVRDTGQPAAYLAKPFEYPNEPERGVTYWDWTLVPVKDAAGEVKGLVLSLQDVTRQVETQQALRQERDRAQTYLDITGVIIVVIARDQTVTLINRYGCEILGYEEHDIVGKNWFDTFVPEQDRETVRAGFEKLVSGELKGVERFENPVLSRSAEERIIAWHNTLLRDKNGEIVGSLSSGQDVTERRRAERALQDLAHDLGERIKELNCLHGVSELVEVPGISLEEIVQGTVDLMPHAWRHPEVTCARIVLDGQEFRSQNFAPCTWQQAADILVGGEPSGTVQVGYLEQRQAADQDPFLHGKISLLNAIAKRLGRIAERMRAQQQLRLQHRFLEVVLDSLAYPFYVINVEDYAVEMANSAAYAVGIGGERTCYALVHGRTHPCEMRENPCPIQQVTRTKRPVVMEHVHLDASGQPRHVEVYGFPITDSEGNVVQMIEYTLDITERKVAEQELRESEARWRSLTETSPDHILMLDMDLNIQFANYASPGLTVDELIGTPLYTLVDEENQAEIKATLESVLRTGTPARYETVYHRPDGGDIYYETHARVRALSGSDQTVGLTLSARDITDRKDAERALRDSEAKLRALFEILPVGISVLDHSRNIQLENPALERILRLSHDQLQSGVHEMRTYLQADGTEMPPGEFPSVRAVREQRAIRDVEIGLVKEDGEQIWSSVSAAPLPFDDWNVIVTTTDITSRKRAQAELRRARDELEQRVQERTAELVQMNETLRAEIAERQRVEKDLRASEERFRQFAENADEILWFVEPGSGQLLYVSSAFEKVWGRSLESLPETFDALLADVHPDDRHLIPRDLGDDWTGHEAEFRIVPPDGQQRWIRIRAFPIHDEMGKLYRIVGLAADITVQKQAQAALSEAEQLAIAGRLAASLAHEINNPLQAAIGCLDLSLEQLDQGEDPRRHLKVTASALDRASRVVAQLRRLHYPRDMESKEAIDVNRLLENVLVLIQKRCGDQGVEMIWQGAPDLPPFLLGPDAIHQVFLNLALNALDAMPEGGQLQVSTGPTQEPPGIQIRFRDTGKGILPDALDRVFEPFFTTKRDSLGLGLFISQRIVQEHGGRIEVQSEERKGTTFTVWLPLSSQEAGQNLGMTR